jgi:predicted transcriptional regulator
MSQQRYRILTRITTHPGEHFNRLAKKLDLAPGQVQYHIRQLERQNQVIEENLYGRTHYYIPSYGGWERRAIAVLRRETAREILFHLLENGESSPNEITDALSIARSTLEWHVDHLVEQDLVRKQRDPRNHVTLTVANPANIVALLEEIKPTFQARMVDRLTRFVDTFLED